MIFSISMFLYYHYLLLHKYRFTITYTSNYYIAANNIIVNVKVTFLTLESYRSFGTVVEKDIEVY